MESLTSLTIKKANFAGEELQDLLSVKLQELVLLQCDLKWNSNRETRNDSIENLKIWYKDEVVSDDSIDAYVHLLSSCDSVSNLEVRFNDFEDRQMPVFAAVANKLSITSLTITNPEIGNATTFPSVENLSIRAKVGGLTYIERLSESEKDDISKLVKANPQIKILELDNAQEGDDNFEALLQGLLPETAYIGYTDDSEFKNLEKYSC